MEISKDALARACKMVSSHCGLEFDNRGEETGIIIKGRFVDCYLLVAVLAERIAAGDIEIKEVADNCGKEEYFHKLLKSIDKITPEDV